MKRYQVKLKLSNGDELQTKVMARNQADAIRRLEQTPEVVEFIGDNKIVNVDIEPIKIESIDNERFAVTTIDNKPGWYLCADLDKCLKVEWKKGNYNKTNRVMPLSDKSLDNADAGDTATAIREIGEFLFNNFSELL